MVIILGGLISLIIGVILLNKGFELSGTLLTVIGACLSVIMLIAWPLSYYGDKTFIAQYYTLQQTIENARNSNISDVERAAILNKIADENMELRSLQYWNQGVLDIFHPDEVMNLKPLQ